MMEDEALGFEWDKDICRNHSLLLSLWKFSFCCGQPANPNRPLACGGDPEVRETLECFSFPFLIDSSNPNSYLAVCLDVFAIDWFDGRKKSLGHSKPKRKSCDSVEWSERVDDTRTFAAYFILLLFCGNAMNSIMPVHAFAKQDTRRTWDHAGFQYRIPSQSALTCLMCFRGCDRFKEFLLQALFWLIVLHQEEMYWAVSGR